LHPVNALKHYFIAVLSIVVIQVSDIGDGVIGLGEVGIAEGVSDAVIRPLDILIQFLP
jgi:hypothetical protein